MALNIKDPRVHETVKQIAAITGESQAQAVATAVEDRLACLREDDLTARLLAIGHRIASRMTADVAWVDHAEMLYDDRGLPA